MNENLELWNSVCKTNPEFAKQVSIGKRKFHSIDAIYQVKSATEKWGPMGKDWGVRDEMFTFPGGNDCIYTAILFSPSGEIPIHSNISTHVEKVVWEGNAKTDKKKLVVDEDYAKKVATDALTKGLSKWGFNADVFEGKFDDDKYVKSLEMEQEIGRASCRERV